METQKLQNLLKTASQDLRTANDVIVQLSADVRKLEHSLSVRDTAIKLASSGLISTAELPEKVAEFAEKTAEELELEQKVASYSGGPSHRLHDNSHARDAGTSAMSFLTH